MTEEEFDALKTIKPYYNNFNISGVAENGALTFECNYLSSDNKCSINLFKGLECRRYPHSEIRLIKRGLKPFKDCGYTFEPKVSFKKTLESLKSSIKKK